MYLTRRQMLHGIGGLTGLVTLGGCKSTLSPEKPARGAAADGHAGFTPDGLRRLHDVTAGHVTSGEVPGYVTVIARGGEVHTDVFGTQAAGGKGGPMTRDSIFRIASVSKPITAAATMILVEEGKLQLDEPVDRLLPELANRRVLRRLDGPLNDTVPAKRAITVRDVLTFRLGFGLILAEPGSTPILKAMDELELGQGMPRPSVPPAPDEWLRRLGTLPLMHQPGEKWMYNTGSDVLGVLIARAAGQSLETFLQDRLFEPLGMKDTAFFVQEKELARFTTSYLTNPATGALSVYDEPGGQWSRAPKFPSCAGGLVSTAEDCLAFGQMLLNGGEYGGRRLLSAKSVQEMTTDQLTPEQKAISGFDSHTFEHMGWGYATSVITSKDPLLPFSPGTSGWIGGFGTALYVDPREGMVTVLLTQRALTGPTPPPKVFLDFWNAAYAARR